MKRRQRDELRSKLSLITEKAGEIAAAGQEGPAGVEKLLTKLGIGNQGGVKVMVNAQDKFAGVVTPAGLAQESSKAGPATDEAEVTVQAQSGNQDNPHQTQADTGGQSSGIISEGELFDEFIDGNVNNSMIFANYTNSGNLTLVFNFYNSKPTEDK